MSESKKFLIAIIFSFFIILIGTFGYMFIERWNFLDSLYMTIITISTVGYGEIHKMTPRGQIFTMFLIGSGIGIIFYIAGSLAQVIIEGRLREVLGRKKLEQKIKQLKNHYIVCGYGRVGTIICSEIASKSIPFVIIERDPSAIEKVNENGYLYLQGEATDESVLIKAGIERARGLISVLGSDADNVFTIITAKGINPNLRIIARACEEGAVKKLKKVGADKVISPYRTAARRIVQAILRPTISDFMELAVHGHSVEFQMEEIPVGKGSSLTNLTLQESGIRQNLDVIVIGIRRISGRMIFNPSAKTKIMDGDTLIVLGEVQNLKKLEKLCIYSPPEGP